MADNYFPMGNTPDWYSSMLGAAQRNLVRMPDGSLAPAPVYSAPTSLSQIYGGVLPSASAAGSAALTSHPVKIIAVDAGTGQPVSASIAQLRGNSGVMKTTGQAGNVGLPSGVVPASVTRMMGDMSAGGSASAPVNPTGFAKVAAVGQPSGSVAVGKNQDRMPPTPVLAFGDAPPTPPAVAAITRMADPFAGAMGTAFGRARVPTVPTVPTVVANNVPKPSFLSTIGAGLQDGFNHTLPGHIVQFATGRPVTGGFLSLLQGNPIQAAHLVANGALATPQVTASDPLQKLVLAAQAQGQTYDRSTDPSFNPNSGWGKGNSLAGF